VKPPALFLLAGEESGVPGGAQACVELAEALKAAGQEVTVQVYEGVDHAWDIQDIAPGHSHVYVPDAAADARERLLAFVSGVAR